MHICFSVLSSSSRFLPVFSNGALKALKPHSQFKRPNNTAINTICAFCIISICIQNGIIFFQYSPIFVVVVHFSWSCVCYCIDPYIYCTQYENIIRNNGSLSKEKVRRLSVREIHAFWQSEQKIDARKKQLKSHTTTNIIHQFIIIRSVYAICMVIVWIIENYRQLFSHWCANSQKRVRKRVLKHLFFLWACDMRPMSAQWQQLAALLTMPN